jgi:hypothetical protein
MATKRLTMRILLLRDFFLFLILPVDHTKVKGIGLTDG